MTDNAFRRFLGVDEDADPRTLLALARDERNRVRIETALRSRLAQVYRHPDGRSPEAERVRLRVRKAAATLLEEIARSAAAAGAGRVRPRAGVRPGLAPSSTRAGGAVALTEFDRQVLAVLVGCGGWNARSRARLVGLAGAHGVAPSGLITIVKGLSDYARSGGARLGVPEITPAVRVEPSAAAPPAGPSPVDRILDRMSRAELVPELTDNSLASVVKLSVLFGFIAILAGALFVRGLVGGRSAEPDVEAPAHITAAPPASELVPTVKDVADGAVRLARFRPLPTFLGHALPMASTDAADHAPSVPQEIDLVTRKLSITDEPSGSVYRAWTAAVDTIAVGWVLVDDSTRSAIDRAVRDALQEAANAPSKGDRLLDALVPPRGRLVDSVDVWRGAWRTGVLAEIAASPRLPPAVVEQARRMLSVALGDGADSASDFTEGASAWLALAVEDLVDRTELDDDVFDLWEMWLAAERALGGRARMQRALMDAIARTLESSTDLSKPGPTVDVLGRLLMSVDLTSSRVVRDAALALFERRDTVDDHDLWVFTSLLAQMDTAPWFGPDLVLPDDAGLAFRNRIRDRIADQWPSVDDEAHPVATGRRLQIDPRAGAVWRDALIVLETAPEARTDIERLERVLLAARLNEAALLLTVRKRAEAEALLDEIEASVAELSVGARSSTLRMPVSPDAIDRGVGAPSRRGHGGAAPPRRGQAIGNDGVWGAAYLDVRRNTAEKLKWLRSLRNQGGTDLGPLDAEVFVREVYRGSPQEVRSVARAIATEQFVDGPDFAMELLDQFPEAPRASPELSEFVRRLTGRLLPSTRSETWVGEARLALARHALDLRRNAPSDIDDLATLLRESLTNRAGVLEPGSAVGIITPTPQAAAVHLADVWRDRAGAVIARTAVPDDLPGLERRRSSRRRLARGPIQLLVAEQITTLDYLAYVTVAEQPDLAEAVDAVLSTSAARRRDAANVLTQAAEAELTMGRVWAMRIALPADENEQGEMP